MEQRRNARTSVANIDVELLDKYGISTGILKNVSKFGVCITGIPRIQQAKNSLLPALISGKGYMIILQLEEKWIKKKGAVMVMGAKLDNAPLCWMEMVRDLEHKNKAKLSTAS